MICGAVSTAVLALSSCVSFYSAGPFGHESIPVPPRLSGGPTFGEKDPSKTEISLLGRFNKTSASFVPEDQSWFAQTGIMGTRYTQFSENFRADLSATITGWYGRVSFGDVFSVPETAGLIPGSYDFYGGTGQLAAFLRVGRDVGFRVGEVSLISYETGAYSDFRRKIAVINPSASSISYVNLSPTPWSHSHRLEASLDFPVGDEFRLQIGADCGYGFPTITWNEKQNYFVVLGGLTGIVRYQQYSLFASYRVMDILNNSLNLGLIVAIN